MAKNARQKSKPAVWKPEEMEQRFPEIVEKRFKLILQVMSWTVGISFILIIILPNFEFFLVDEIVKFVYFLGILNLILFAVVEMLATPLKELIRKFSS